MAIRLKTVEFAGDAIASVTSAVATNLTQTTIYLPETKGASPFKKVVVHIFADDAGTAASTTITARTIAARVGAAGYTTVTNTTTYTPSGETVGLFHAADFTSHFNTNWTGTSMTFDVQVTLTGNGTGIAWRNVHYIVYITYEYDDTSTTQVKTVWIPLNMPVGAMGTTKPGAAVDTIPNLSTLLPEASKVFRNLTVVLQGNMANTTGTTTDSTMSMQLDTTTARTTASMEAGQTSDRWMRYVWDVSAVLNTSSTMGFYVWGSVARYHHWQAWMIVTYEFDASASNDMFVSLMLPMEIASPMGGTTVASAQQGFRELWIEEPGTVTTQQLAFYMFWDQAAAISTLNLRIGSGSFVVYTDTAAALCGGNGAMIRNDSAHTLARGRNTLAAGAWRSDTTDLGFNLSGFWIVNYTAGKPTQGYGAANHTVRWNLGALFEGTANVERTIAATAPSLAATDYFLNAIGTNYQYITNTTGTAAGVTVLCERLASEGGLAWEPAYVDIGYTDPETGLRQCWSQIRTLFKRWPGDTGPDRMDFEQARRWKTILANNCASFDYLDLLFTYHTITFDVSGTISGSGGGTITIDLERESTGEKVKTTSRVGDGAFTFTWYDDTEPVYVSCREDATHVGRSDEGLAGT